MSGLPRGLHALLVIGLCCAGCGGDRSSSAGPPTIVFDESLGELFSIRDPGFQGYSRAAQTLRDQGYRVGTNIDPLDSLVAATTQASGKVLVVALPTQTPSPFAVTSVRDFVRRGGGLLLLAEHDGIYGNAASLNALLAGSPLTVDSGQAASVLHRELSPGPITVAQSAAFNLDSVVLYLTAPVRSEAGAAVTVLAGPSHGPVALGALVGRGRTVVVGDAEWLWNGTPAVGLRAGQNLAFLLGVVTWLAGPGGHDSPDHVAAPSVPASSPAIVAWADADGHPFGTGPDEYGALVTVLRRAGFSTVVTADPEAVGGATVVLVADPTRPLPAAASNHPVVTLLHATSGPPPPWGPGGAAPAEHPATVVLEHSGMVLHAGLLHDSGQPTDDCRWHRPAILTTARDEAVVHRWAGQTSTAALDLMPVVTPARSAPRWLSPPAAGGRWPLLLETPSALVFASGSVLVNAGVGTSCYQGLTPLLVQWVERVMRERAGVP